MGQIGFLRSESHKNKGNISYCLLLFLVINVLKSQFYFQIHIREFVKARCKDKGIDMSLKNNNNESEIEGIDEYDPDYIKEHGLYLQ